MFFFYYLIEGIIDSSGMRVKMTSHLRQHDASSLSFTHHIDVRQVVPPKQEAFITRGFCAPQCTLNVSVFSNVSYVVDFNPGPKTSVDAFW